MQKLALGALIIGLFAACGGGGTKIVDSNVGSGGPICDPIAQTGCPTDNPRCTWVQDTASVGHVDCVAAGTAAIGADCMAGSAFPSFDDCDAGGICINGKCETICDNNAGGSACGSGFACGIYNGLFEVNGSFEAGACDKTCDPFADNSFGSGGSGDIIPPKTGTTCGSDQGCYGFPSDDPTNTTHFTCGGELNTNLVNRSACLPGTGGNDPGCAHDSMNVYLNGCAQGYIPLLSDTNLGTTNAVCIAYCIPQDCYAGGSNCGSDNNAQVGSGGHACLQTAMREDPTEPLPQGSAAANNSCIYWWVFEENSTMGAVADSSFERHARLLLRPHEVSLRLEQQQHDRRERRVRSSVQRAARLGQRRQRGRLRLRQHGDCDRARRVDDGLGLGGLPHEAPASDAGPAAVPAAGRVRAA